jgi:hypothetical protein
LESLIFETEAILTEVLEKNASHKTGSLKACFGGEEEKSVLALRLRKMVLKRLTLQN